jgi:hypothetical protein
LFLSELARFELLLHKSFFVKTAEEFNLKKFQKLPQKNFPNLVFFLHPSAVFFESKFAIFSIWQKRKASKNFSKKERAIIFSNRALPLNEEEFLFLSCVKKQKKLYESYEFLCKKTGKEIDIGALMNHFISNGVIVNYE